MARDYDAATVRNWEAWVRRGERRNDPADAARMARALETLPDGHPSLKPISTAQREGWSRRLLAIANGA